MWGHAQALKWDTEALRMQDTTHSKHDRDMNRRAWCGQVSVEGMGAHDVLMQPCDASSAHLSWTGRDEAGASRLKDSITGPGRFMSYQSRDMDFVPGTRDKITFFCPGTLFFGGHH